MAEWTAKEVASRLREVSSVRQRLLGYAASPGPSSARQLRRVGEVTSWLDVLDPDESQLLWLRAEGAPWKVIGWRFGASRATAHRRWTSALQQVADRLNHPDLDSSRRETSSPTNARARSVISNERRHTR